MLKLLLSIFKRISTAITSPFRAIIIRFQRMFNINVISAKLVAPLTKKVKKLITLKPQSREDYYVIGRHWIYKKLFLTLVLVLCAGVMIYFTMFAPKLPVTQTVPAAAVETNVSYDYDDMALREFTGVANIRASDGRIVYTGDIAAGICKGNGSLYDRSGKLLYVGGFEQNKYIGKGVCYYPSGKVKYEGEFANNLYQGEGVIYSTEGVVTYTGSFSAGLYSGTGKLYAEKDLLLYEGSFADGKYHGDGVVYYNDGTVKYKGTFFQGLMQGHGELYSKTGKLLYTGDVYDDAINYRSLVHSTLADVESAFSETPRIFYTDTDSAFVYEQAGVIVTVDCRVLVDTWEKPSTDTPDGEMYYIPDGTMPDQNVASSDPNVLPQDEVLPDVTIPDATTPDATTPDATTPDVSSSQPEDLWLPPNPLILNPNEPPMQPETPGQTLRSTFYATSQDIPVINTLLASNFETPFEVTPIAWYVADDSGNVQYGDSGSSSDTGSSSNTSATVAAGSTGSSGQSSSQSGSATGSSSLSGTPEISVVVPEPGEKRPDFVQKSDTLYFEIDKNVWQSEKELDRSKVQIKKITVFDPQMLKPPKEAVEYRDNTPPSMEDCVAIDFIRQNTPTAFPQVVFESDNQNHSFVKLDNINFAAAISSRAYLSDDLTYRYCYTNKVDNPLFFSIER